jgi:hypothetical protein
MAAKQEKQRLQRQVLQATHCSHMLLPHSLKPKMMTMDLGTLMRHQLLRLHQLYHQHRQQRASRQY